MQTQVTKEYYDIKNRSTTMLLGNKLYELIKNIDKNYIQIVFICIGTNRVIGDCFAPLIGSYLYNLSKLNLYNYNVYGTIHVPVHALNLHDILNSINLDDSLVIAIDASVGSANKVGHLTAWEGKIAPGAGVDKELPKVGDVSIAGVVNIKGLNNFLLLQHTPLDRIMDMSKITFNAIKYALYKLKKDKII